MLQKENDWVADYIRLYSSKDVSDLVKTTKIPLNLFQTWHTKSLPLKMSNAVNQLKLDNPEFKHQLFNDNECREFIRENFPVSVLNAFDRLVPGAFKADLWRNCVLYVHGGIYLDIKYECVPGFKLIELTQSEYFVRDRVDGPTGQAGIYNALMVCKPKNKILHQSIYAIVENVKNKYYGISHLQPTGPLLMNRYFSPWEIQCLELSFSGDSIQYTDPHGKSITILYIYPEYRMEQQQSANKSHYGELWRNKSIYV